MTKFGAVGLVFGMSILAPSAAAMTASIEVQAVRTPGPPPTTTFVAEVCICMSTSELAALLAVQPMPTVNVTIGGACTVTENDPIDDDELTATLAAAAYAVPYMWTLNDACPPSPPTCIPFATLAPPVPDPSYGAENPGEFQLGAAGSQEGTVPAGTTVTVGPVATSPSMPNRSS